MGDLNLFASDKTIQACEANQEISWDPSRLFAGGSAKVMAELGKERAMENLKVMAAYNHWANRLVYDAAAALSEGELHRDTGAFFGSVFGTLSHLLTADRVWLHRFTGEGPHPATLDERPYSTFPELRAARKIEDIRIIVYVDSLSTEQLESQISYTPLSMPGLVQHRLSPALSHMFNHQTHHRGQVHAGLTGLGKPSLAIDLIYFLRLEGQAWL
jgi:uncharacterized damage-inducible protein DinB